MHVVFYCAAIVVCTLVLQVKCLPPNFEDLEFSEQESDGAVVDVTQDSPQSNAIHVAHNIPKNSDIKIKQTR